MKRLSLVIALLVVAAACSSSEPTGSDSPTRSDAGVSQTSAPGASGSGQLEGPSAPNFTMALASGDSFTLYDEQKPVYMIFWAEW